MIIEPKDLCIAYRCPVCGFGVKSLVGIFSLSGEIKRLKCDCKHSYLDIRTLRDGKLQMTIPCIFCREKHTFTISSNAFFDNRLRTLCCPSTGMEILFVGGVDEVSDALDRSEDDIRRILNEAGVDWDIDFASVFGGEPNEDFEPRRPDNISDEEDEDDRRHDPDPVIYDAVMFQIKSLIEEGEVSCLCDLEDAHEHSGHSDAEHAHGGEHCSCGHDHSEDEYFDGDVHRSRGDFAIAESDDHVKLFCRRCGASKDFPIDDPSFARRFLDTDHITLERK